MFAIEGVEIAHNHVVMHDVQYGGISLLDGTSRTLVVNNRVEGGGLYALGATFVGFAEPAQESNVIVDNDITRFGAISADVFLDTTSRHNIIVGHGGTALDLGVDNLVVGLAPAAQAQLPTARRTKLEHAMRMMMP